MFKINAIVCLTQYLLLIGFYFLSFFRFNRSGVHPSIVPVAQRISQSLDAVPSDDVIVLVRLASFLPRMASKSRAKLDHFEDENEGDSCVEVEDSSQQRQEAARRHLWFGGDALHLRRVEVDGEFHEVVVDE